MGEDTGLAGTGAGEHEQVAGFGTDRFALRGVQAVEQVGDIHPGILRDERHDPRARTPDHTGPQTGFNQNEWPRIAWPYGLYRPVSERVPVPL